MKSLSACDTGFFFMHGGCPPASSIQSGLTTGNGAFIASRKGQSALCTSYQGCKALPGTFGLKRA